MQRSDEGLLWQEDPQRAGPLILLRLAFRHKGRIRVKQLSTPNPTLQPVAIAADDQQSHAHLTFTLETAGNPLAAQLAGVLSCCSL